MEKRLISNKLLIIKGILAEKCGLLPSLYDELSDLINDVQILSDAKDEALAKVETSDSVLPIPVVSGLLPLTETEIDTLEKELLERYGFRESSILVDAQLKIMNFIYWLKSKRQ